MPVCEDVELEPVTANDSHTTPIEGIQQEPLEQSIKQQGTNKKRASSAQKQFALACAVRFSNFAGEIFASGHGR